MLICSKRIENRGETNEAFHTENAVEPGSRIVDGSHFVVERVFHISPYTSGIYNFLV